MKRKLLSMILVTALILFGCGSESTVESAVVMPETTPTTAPHNYISESTSATCMEAGKIRTYCSICGNVQSEKVGEAAKGHVAGEKSYWPLTPSCMGAANYSISCSVCGEFLERGTTPTLPHTEVATETQQGNCVVSTVISYDCSVCGAHIREESFTTDNHDWITGEGEVFNMNTLEWEIIATNYCSRCGRNAQ